MRLLVEEYCSFRLLLGCYVDCRPTAPASALVLMPASIFRFVSLGLSLEILNDLERWFTKSGTDGLSELFMFACDLIFVACSEVTFCMAVLFLPLAAGSMDNLLLLS